MTNRIAPLTNLLESETQFAYEKHKSADGVIYPIKRRRIIKTHTGQILLGRSIAFGKIDRPELWNILYGEGCLYLAFISYGMDIQIIINYAVNIIINSLNLLTIILAYFKKSR